MMDILVFMVMFHKNFKLLKYGTVYTKRKIQAGSVKNENNIKAF